MGSTIAALKGIEERCIWRRYRSGERVFERGTEGHEVFFVVEGAVDVISPTPSGTDFNFARIGEGEVLGHLAAIDGLPRAASVVAAEDSLLAALALRSVPHAAPGERRGRLTPVEIPVADRSGDQRARGFGKLS